MADGGHYWSIINTNRGKDEPDAQVSAADWLASNEANWKKFDDGNVDHYMLHELEGDTYGGENTGYSAFE